MILKWMNIKHLTSVKVLLISLMTITIFITTGYMIIQKNIESHNSQFNGLTNLQLKKLDKLLSPHEQAALIRQIVNDSLQRILEVQNNMMSIISPIKQIVNISTNENANNKYKKKLDSNILQRVFHHAPVMSQNHSVRNSELKPFQVQMTLEERSKMYELLEVFDKKMKEHNITYFMYGGTLLGSYRHHDLIPWDDDLDVILSAIDHKNMETIFKSLEPDYILYRAGGHDKFYHKSAKKASGYNWLWPYLDISYYEVNGTFIKDWVRTYSYWYYFPKEIVFPLHNRPLLHLSLPAPKDTFAFLTWSYNYGSECVMYGYSHMVEGGGPSGRTECSSLADKFPFVEHLPDANGVREVLKYKDMEITDIVLPEPQYAVSETFKLSLKPGYTMPSQITPPPV